MIFFAIFIIVKKNLRLIYLSLGNISVYTNTQLHTKNVLFKLLTKNNPFISFPILLMKWKPFEHF